MTGAIKPSTILLLVYCLGICIKNGGATDPANCSRYFKGNRTAVSCANSGLDEFPQNLTELVS